MRKFNLTEAGKYLGGDTSLIPPRRMRELAKLITHVRISPGTGTSGRACF
jgi:hypothetical protein